MKKTIKFYTEGWVCECKTLVPIGIDCHKCSKSEPADLPNIRTWDDEFTYEFPAKNVVCDTCQGTGSTYLGFTSDEQPAFTAEDFADEGPDFEEDYFNGGYDRECPECKGNKVVLEIVEDNIPEASKGIWNAYMSHLQGEAEYAAEVAAERRMGA